MIHEITSALRNLHSHISFGGGGSSDSGGQCTAADPYGENARDSGWSAASSFAADAAKACVVGGAMGAVAGSAVPAVGTVGGALAGCATAGLGVAVSSGYDIAFGDGR